MGRRTLGGVLFVMLAASSGCGSFKGDEPAAGDAAPPADAATTPESGTPDAAAPDWIVPCLKTTDKQCVGLTCCVADGVNGMCQSKCDTGTTQYYRCNDDTDCVGSDAGEMCCGRIDGANMVTTTCEPSCKGGTVRMCEPLGKADQCGASATCQALDSLNEGGFGQCL